MKIASVSTAKNKLSALLREVRQGTTILICDHGNPVARLEPANLAEGKDRRARLEKAGLIRWGSGSIDPQFWQSSLPQTKDQSSVVDALFAEREENR